MRPAIGQVGLVRVVGGDARGADREDALVLALPRVFRDQVAAELQLRRLLSRCGHRVELSRSDS